ncbi:MAG: hypothetical protein NC200_02305 [Candidatus Gastranaerophilales bacterium]|nr:hypothetical protein [Candidatus Gastranaerophilales bacterium]
MSYAAAPVTSSDPIKPNPTIGHVPNKDSESGQTLNITDEKQSLQNERNYTDCFIGKRFIGYSNPIPSKKTTHGEDLEIGHISADLEVDPKCLEVSIQNQIDAMVYLKKFHTEMTETINNTQFLPGFRPMPSPMGVLVITPQCVTITMDDYIRYFQQQSQPQYA